jgi:hypothetical protein
MTVHQARSTIAILSILSLGIVFAFFTMAPAMGFHSLQEDEWRIPQMVMPVFAGYLASASQFLFSDGNEKKLRPRTAKLMRTLIYGGFGLFFFCSMILIGSYLISHSYSAAPGSGRSLEWLSSGFAIILSILAATTTIISNYLFAVHDGESKR